MRGGGGPYQTALERIARGEVSLFLSAAFAFDLLVSGGLHLHILAGSGGLDIGRRQLHA